MDIKWQDPPAHGKRGKWHAVAAALRERPGQWALVAEDASSASSGSHALKDHGCEVVTRKCGNERHLYARWPEASK